MNIDDVSVGDTITVLRWLPVERPLFEGGGLFGGLGLTPVSTYQHQDTSYVGAVLVVVAVSLPFVAVAQPLYPAQKPVSLDLRRCEVTRLSPEYADALINPPAASGIASGKGA